MPIPLAELSNEPEDLTLKFSAEGGSPIEISNTAWLDRPRALIVSDAEDPADGSRFYRGELLAAQLRAAGVVCDIMGKQQAADALAEEVLHAPSYGIVVFLRCPLNEGTQSLLHAFREAHSLVLADVDGLKF